MSGRLTAGALLSAAGILLGTVALPAAASAQAQPPNITILSAGPDASGDPYDLTVAADDANVDGNGVGLMIQTMTAHVISASDQDVADVPMSLSPPDQTDATDQTFAATNPIDESALPPGTYTVTVDATDADEQDQDLAAPGSFTVSYTSSALSVVASPPTVTYGSTDVTFNGTFTGTAPGGTPVGIANAPVQVSIAGAAAVAVGSTDANGNFSYQADGITQSTEYDFSVAAASDGSYPAPPDDSADDITVSTDQSTTAMTVTADPSTVTEGMQTVSFSGTVTVTPPPPAVQTPVGIGSGVPVYLSINGTAQGQVATTDDVDGDFAYDPSGNVQPGTYTFSVGQTSLYQGVSADATVTAVAAPGSMSVTASPGYITFGAQSVTFNGTVTATNTDAQVGIGSGVPVYLNGSSSPVTDTTDSAGDFSYSVSDVSSSLDDTFSVNPDSTGLYSGAMYEVRVPVDLGSAAITGLKASPPDIDLATSDVTFSGTVAVTPYGSTTPVGVGSGVPVMLSIGGGTPNQVTTTDDASGDFSYPATGVTSAADYTFSVAGQPLYTGASASFPIGSDALAATLAVTPDPISVTEGSQSVTFTGELTGVSPNGGSSVPIANAPVDLDGVAISPAVTTDANGDFTYTASNISQLTVYKFSIPSSASYTGAMDNVTVALSPATTRITGLKASPTHVKYGQSTTLTGTVQYQSGTTWTALPSAVVRVTENKTSLGSVTANKSGGFTATLPSTHGPAYTLEVSASGLLQQGTATGNLNIALPLKVRSFSATLSATDRIHAEGCLQVAAPTGTGPQTTVAIDYATSAHGTMRLLGRLPLHSEAGKYKTCPASDEGYFSGDLPAKVANGYYRADFAPTYSYQRAVSKTVHAWRYRTRIVSFSISPRTVSKGHYITIKGRLETHRSSWRGWGNQKVSILYNYKGTSLTRSLGTARTSSKGYFTLKAGAQAGSFVAIMFARYAGNSTHLLSQSSRIDVTIDNRSKAGLPTPLDFNVGAPDSLEIPTLPVLAPIVPSLAWLVR